MNHKATIKKITFLAIFALWVNGLAYGAKVPAPLAGDLFLGFRAEGGDGSSQSYIVNLGASTTYRNAAQGSSSEVASIGKIGVDLSSIYGASWNTRADLHWGIFGKLTSVSSSVFASRERSSANVQSTPWLALDATQRNDVDSKINSVINAIGGYRDLEATANSTVGGFQSNFAGAASYNYQVTSGGTDFGTLSQWSSIEGNFSNGAAATVLDLYRLSGSTTVPVQYIGKFTINTAGVVTFTAPTSAPSNADTDGDGWTDADEDIAGTNPANASDFFRIGSLVRSAQGATLSFQSASNRTYNVEYSETLAANSWVQVATLTPGSIAQVVQYTDSDTVRKTKPRGFYRIQVSQ